METIGTYLKRQREIRKIPLEDVSLSTKIQMRFLTALEGDDLGILPGPTFAKGFVKSYARSIGLDPEEANLQLEEHFKTAQNPSAGRIHKFKWLPHPQWQVKPWMLFTLFLLIVIATAYLSSR